MFNPYYPNYQNYTQNYQNYAQNLDRGIVRVNGIQGAQAYQMGANSSVALFDANEDFFYIKTTKGDSEFYKIISGKNLTAVLGVINGLLEAIKCININLYQATLRKLVNLD